MALGIPQGHFFLYSGYMKLIPTLEKLGSEVVVQFAAVVIVALLISKIPRLKTLVKNYE